MGNVILLGKQKTPEKTATAAFRRVYPKKYSTLILSYI
jgi:hypothetical protein